ncbi:MAG: nucleotidyl transferase AbiEii/AbiGii toxin family protein [Luteolibacter sp.]
MKKDRIVTNVSASVRDRLLKLHRDSGIGYQRLLNQHALERLLYRLSVSPARNVFLLKGAMLFTVWQGSPHRMTRDLDLLGFGDPDAERLAGVFRELCAVDVAEDGIVFDPASVQCGEIREAARYPGVRITMRATMGTARLNLQIDIGFGDHCSDPEEIEVPSLLGMPPPHLRAYRRETVVAEKLEAIHLLGLQNTRLKDYFDLWFLARHFHFDGKSLAAAIAATFQRRGTEFSPGLPRGLREDFWSDSRHVAEWKAFWKKAGPGGECPSLEETIRFISDFAGLPLREAAESSGWEESWEPGGPWG